MTGEDVFPGDIEVRVIEYEPGKFAPVIARGGRWEFRGGRVFSDHTSAQGAAATETFFAKQFWARQLQVRERAAVVGGVHYRLGMRNPGSGFGGRTFRLRNLTTGEVTETSDLWEQGPIPDFARPKFPDTHEFVSEGP